MLTDIESTGMKVDGDAVKSVLSEHNEELDKLRERALRVGRERKFNIGSPKQVE